MAGGLNRKILCFIDEYGTAGSSDLYLGAAITFSRDAGRVDKCFSDQLEPNANEVHAAQMTDGYLQGLLHRFWDDAPKEKLVLVNRKLRITDGEAPVLYAQALVETVKIGLARFRKEVLGRQSIGNVEVITDINHHNSHPAFEKEIGRARNDGGLFKGVNQVAKIDSAASRLLQLADLVAYSRKWIVAEELNAAGLRERYGVQIL
jgi:Protein of unknown function (DUF3800)